MTTANVANVDSAALKAAQADLQQRYDDFKAKNLSLDMTRGKPCTEQLDLSLPMLDLVTSSDFKTASGTDTRNYGGVDGLPEAKALFADFLEVGQDEVVIGGNSSLNLMHEVVACCLSHGVAGGEAWNKDTTTFLCPSPGYDRHFSVCEHHGINMVTTGMNADGPDMDEIEKRVADDASIKGIWIVPKYGNPTGTTVSDAVVERLAAMKTAASDFRIFWDNAYTVHHLTNTPDQLANILEACKKAGNDDRVFIFGSTSKVTFAGSGIGAFGGSKANCAWLVNHLSMQTIGPDKINQLRHVRFLKDMNGVADLMKKHAAIIKPKFDAVLDILDAELGGKHIATWNSPNGGYFISLDTLEGCAQDVVALAADAGVKLTKAGATFPYGKDPNNSNIRLAPTLPSMDEIKQAMELVCICIQLVSAKKVS